MSINLVPLSLSIPGAFCIWWLYELFYCSLGFNQLVSCHCVVPDFRRRLHKSAFSSWVDDILFLLRLAWGFSIYIRSPCGFHYHLVWVSDNPNDLSFATATYCFIIVLLEWSITLLPYIFHVQQQWLIGTVLPVTIWVTNKPDLLCFGGSLRRGKMIFLIWASVFIVILWFSETQYLEYSKSWFLRIKVNLFPSIMVCWLWNQTEWAVHRKVSARPTSARHCMPQP